MLSKRKGRVHEQDVAKKLREAFPSATVRRSDQGFGAYEPDVVVEGDAPEIVRKLWIECQCSRNPGPLRKLDQAERDASRRLGSYPVVVWRLHGARTTQATLRGSTLLAISQCRSLLEAPASLCHAVVTLDFDSLLSILGGKHDQASSNTPQD